MVFVHQLSKALVPKLQASANTGIGLRFAGLIKSFSNKWTPPMTVKRNIDKKPILSLAPCSNSRIFFALSLLLLALSHKRLCLMAKQFSRESTMTVCERSRNATVSCGTHTPHSMSMVEMADVIQAPEGDGRPPPCGRDGDDLLSRSNSSRDHCWAPLGRRSLCITVRIDRPHYHSTYP